MAEARADFVTDYENGKTRCQGSDRYDVYLDVMVEATAPRVLSALLNTWILNLKAVSDRPGRDAAASALLALKTYLDAIIALEPPSQ